ncbi:uncharacterized protein LOC118815038 [Colossoma macropomum]|uniref:uncharacterized protein LOC118815038 n=1 Tax=Colossoma macropomum TaxID=42526 RepID=UPI0018644179|nr:uncharacterized protein LOC118815038 [Colossoma macropomum]
MESKEGSHALSLEPPTIKVTGPGQRSPCSSAYDCSDSLFQCENSESKTTPHDKSKEGSHALSLELPTNKVTGSGQGSPCSSGYDSSDSLFQCENSESKTTPHDKSKEGSHALSLELPTNKVTGSGQGSPCSSGYDSSDSLFQCENSESKTTPHDKSKEGSHALSLELPTNKVTGSGQGSPCSSGYDSSDSLFQCENSESKTTPHDKSKEGSHALSLELPTIKVTGSGQGSPCSSGYDSSDSLFQCENSESKTTPHDKSKEGSHALSLELPTIKVTGPGQGSPCSSGYDSSDSLFQCENSESKTTPHDRSEEVLFKQVFSQRSGIYLTVTPDFALTKKSKSIEIPPTIGEIKKPDECLLSLLQTQLCHSEKANSCPARIIKIPSGTRKECDHLGSHSCSGITTGSMEDSTKDSGP